VKHTVLFLLVLAFVAGPVAGAGDIREAALKAAEDRDMALREAREVEERILSDRQALLTEVGRLEAQQKSLEENLTSLDQEITSLEKQRSQLADLWSQREMEFREISGNVRVVGRDLESLLRQSLLTAIAPERLGKVQRLLRKGYFPDIDDISAMADVFLDEIRGSGEVSLLPQAEFVGRSGENRRGPVLTLGKFIAVYRDNDEVGFLSCPPGQQRLMALSALPSGKTRRALRRYIEGKQDAVPIDISRGAALRQITHRATLGDQLRAGGPIAWPILAIGLAALLIVFERLRYLNRVHGNTDRLMGAVNNLAANGNWSACEHLVRKHAKKRWPVINLIMAGLAGRTDDRETRENILQEAILHEVPRLERFLSVLAVLGAVAPLLGLLGTVTGMIDTFRVITLHGTGDPKLMSGGISEALITTELGLAVAIPIMLLHTFLSRRVEHIIGDMEEKAIALTNIIQREQRRDGHAVAHP
jgi:biopolymer transport protein ExbB